MGAPFSCGRHTAYIYDRGGKKRLGQIYPLTSVDWGRQRDDTSFAHFTTTQPSWECQRLLANIAPNRHELVIFRGQERVWEGPLSLVTYTSSSVQVEARDVTYYTLRTVAHAGYDNSYPHVASVVARAQGMITAELARKEALDPPINVVPHLRSYNTVNDAQTSKVTLPFMTTVFDDYDQMAARSGLDYTVVGRSIILFDTHTVFYTTPVVTQADFLGDVTVSVYGVEGATSAYVTDGQGHYGSDGAIDPYYGEWEIFDQAYDEGSDTAIPSVAEMTSQAQRNLTGRNPVPVIVRVPDGSQLSPQSTLQMKDLVPGARVPLRATLTASTFTQMQKLDAVKVSEDSNGETITVTMSPASANDEDGIEG